MSKKNLLLTAWLLAPILVIAGLMWLIFATYADDKPMSELPPVGAGAGDTGDANALGQFLAGRDPDEVSEANRARREGEAVDPFSWPGGTRFVIADPDRTLERVAVGWINPDTQLLGAVELSWSDGSWIGRVKDYRPAPGTPIVVSQAGIRLRVSGASRTLVDDAGNSLVSDAMVPVMPTDLQTGDAIEVVLSLP